MLEVFLAGAAQAVAGAEGQGGLPQLNTHDFVPQLVWLALSFGSLYLLMSNLVVPRVSTAIEARANRIKRDLGEAERLKTATEKALNAYEAAMTDARSKASTMAKVTRDQLAAETDKARAETDRQLAVKLAQAETQIASSRSVAMAEVDRIASDTAGAIVAKLTGGSATPEEITRALKG